MSKFFILIFSVIAWSGLCFINNAEKNYQQVAIIAPQDTVCPQCNGSGHDVYCQAYYCYKGECLQCKGYKKCLQCYGKGKLKRGRDCPSCEDGNCNICKGVGLCEVCVGTGKLICKKCEGIGRVEEEY